MKIEKDKFGKVCVYGRFKPSAQDLLRFLDRQSDGVVMLAQLSNLIHKAAEDKAEEFVRSVCWKLDDLGDEQLRRIVDHCNSILENR